MHGRILLLTLTAGLWPAGLCLARAQSPPPEPPEPPEAPADQTAPDPRARPEAAQRIVRHFDFEERLTNPDPVPRFWLRGQSDPAGVTRPGFPVFNAAELDYGVAHAGEGSLRLPVRGGSTSLVLEPGVIPIFADADYKLSAQVRTSGLTHARATVIARMLDAAGKPIPGSERRTEAVVSNEAWRPVSVELVGVFPDAAFMQLELAALQPEQMAQGGAGPFQVWPQDLAGAAWFDDVSVTQLPRIELSTDTPGNAIQAPVKPTLVASIRDLTGETLTLSLELTDASGATVATMTGPLASGNERIAWTPELDRFGWYRATLAVSNASGRVGSAATDLVWLPPMPVASGADENASRRLEAARRQDRLRFGVTIDDLPAHAAAALPTLVDRLGVGSVWMPAWDDGVTPDNAADRARAITPLVESVLGQDRRVTIVLPRLPEAIARALDVPADRVWALAGSADQPAARSAIDPFVDRLGQRVSRWQIGPTGSLQASSRPDLAGDLDALRRTTLRLVPGAVVGLPWTAEVAPPRTWWSKAPGLNAFSVLVPWQTPESAMAELLASWSASATPSQGELTLVFEPPPEDELGPDVAAAELVRRAVEARAASDLSPGAVRVDAALPAPWRDEGSRRPRVAPTAAFAAWRNLADRLDGRKIIGSLPTAQGVTCYVLAPVGPTQAGATGALVAWNTSAPPDRAVLRLALGAADCTVLDIFGNASPAPMASEFAQVGDRRVERTVSNIPLGHAPVFVEGVDIELVRFVAGFRLEPATLETTSQARVHEMVFRNPWPVTLAARYVIAELGGFDPRTGARDRSWRITPRSGRFQATPGQEVRVPVSVSYGTAEEAGPRDWVLDLELTAGRVYESVRLRWRVDVGLDYVALELRAVPRPGGTVAIEALVTNTGDTGLDAQLTAFVPGRPRSKATVSGVPPGTQALRVFTIENAEQMRGARVAVVLSDTARGARLLRTITLD